MTDEQWSWGRFFSGFISGKRYGKDFAILVRVTILAVAGILVVAGVVGIKNHFFGRGAEAKPSIGVIDSGGAPVDNSTKKSFWSLFYFGGQNQ